MMDEEKRGGGNTVLLTVIGIATLLVAIVGATFAYFTASVSGNEEASSINLRTAKIANVVFAETTATINENDVLPGWSASKTFTVTRAAGASINQAYRIRLDYANDITDLYYSLTKNGAYVNAGGVNGTQLLTDNTTVDIDTGSFTLTTEEENTYVLTVWFKETGTSQNEQQYKTFAGIVQVDVDGGTNLYYNNANPTGTTTPPAAQTQP